MGQSEKQKIISRPALPFNGDIPPEKSTCRNPSKTSISYTFHPKKKMLQTSAGPVPQDTAMELQHDLKARVPLFTSQFHSFFANAKVDFSNFVFQVSDLQRCVPTKMWGTWSGLRKVEIYSVLTIHNSHSLMYQLVIIILTFTSVMILFHDT